MNREKLSSQLIHAIDMGSDPSAKFRVRIIKNMAGNIAAFCLLGVNENQVKEATLTITADILLEQVVLLSHDTDIQSISTTITTIEPGPPVTGC